MLLNIEEILLYDKKTEELNNIYIKLLGVAQYNELEEKIWKNLKEENIYQKSWTEIQTEMIVEKTLIYAIMLKDEDGFNRIVSFCNSLNMVINKKYEQIKEDYNLFINELRIKENLYNGEKWISEILK